MKHISVCVYIHLKMHILCHDDTSASTSEKAFSTFILSFHSFLIGEIQYANSYVRIFSLYSFVKLGLRFSKNADMPSF